ncbi:hypothetical protein [Litchfieldia alkalitelluris]|uniref:hypothetical protein n=1 Tax=Litchfieldia alkalitelluris TaxID=304268 RepID=UPI00099769B2|nr:hypothetical protein [Litchfieldia alkalitelluris]
MFRKLVVAVSIFVIIFLGAWYLNGETKREYFMNNDEGDYQIQHNAESYFIEGVGDMRIFPAFMSREYIRVDR